MQSAVYSNEELEKVQKQEVTLTLPAGCLHVRGFTILLPLSQVRRTDLFVCVL